MSAALLLALALAQAPDGGVTDDRYAALEERVAELEEQLARTKASVEAVELKQSWAEKLSVHLSGYLDVGFFAVQGNGSGVRKDLGRTAPQFDDILSSWVLVGDPLATAINSRGDPADLGDSRALPFDPIHSEGRPTFLVNALNLGFRGEVGDELFVTALVDFLPRDRAITNTFLGDFFDLKLAYLQWRRELGFGTLSLYAGKVDPVQGIEYRQQEAPDRLTVTPSLLCRYTCGRQVGLKARATFFEQLLELSLAVTNGSSVVELFPFSNESDFNRLKTVSGRVAVRLPVALGLELSISGALGPQDRQPDDGVAQWHVGGAARFAWRGLMAQAELVTGRAAGKSLADVPCGAAACLRYTGAYGLAGYTLARTWTPYLRVDWRSATMRSARDYAYVSDTLRATLGLRYEPLLRVQVKAEYTLSRELAGFEFPSDVFTTSVVVKF